MVNECETMNRTERIKRENVNDEKERKLARIKNHTIELDYGSNVSGNYCVFQEVCKSFSDEYGMIF